MPLFFLFAFFGAGKHKCAHFSPPLRVYDGQLGAAPLTRKEFSSPSPLPLNDSCVQNLAPNAHCHCPTFFRVENRKKEFEFEFTDQLTFWPTAMVKKALFCLSLSCVGNTKMRLV